MKGRIYLTFALFMLLAMVITTLVSGIYWVRINWALLVLLYWASRYPAHIGPMTALLSGMIFDLLAGSLLGSMSLSMILIVYFLQILRPPLEFFKLIQQFFIVFLLIAGSLLIHFWVQLFIGRPVIAKFYAYTTFSTALAWPIISRFLRKMLKAEYSY